MLKLWIDDVRDPPDKTWVIARQSGCATDILFYNLDRIGEISFDHDLGGEDTAYEVVEFLEEMAAEGNIDYHFVWNIHSQNPVGRARLMAGLQAVDRLIEENIAEAV